MTRLILLVAPACLCVAIVLALSIIGVVTTERRGVARSVAADPGAGLAPRACSRARSSAPSPSASSRRWANDWSALGRKLVRADTAQKIQYRLNIAGNPPAWDVNRILGLKVLGLGVFGGARLPLPARARTGRSTSVVARDRGSSAAFGYVLPNVLLYNAGQKRETLMRNALPDAMDLLTDLRRGGPRLRRRREPRRQEQRRVRSPRSSPACSRRCRSAWAAPRPCAPWPSAPRLPDLKSFCLAMVQADSLGIPIARVLRIQSQEMRTKRRQRAEEKAQQVPVRIMIPLVLFILPCLFIVILGPAGIQIADTFGSM